MSAAPSAVERAFAAAYGGDPAEARAVRAGAGEDAVVRGLAAYRGQEHWHLVTVGLTDAHHVPRDPAAAGGRPGMGQELTLLTPAAERPPAWAFDLLLGAARTSVAVGRPFHAGARLAPGAPVDGADSALVALGLREDPVVVVPGPAAPLLLQLVGVTLGEYLLMQRVGTATVLDRLARRDPLLRTDPARG